MQSKPTLREIIEGARAEIEQWPQHMRDALERRRELEVRIARQEAELVGAAGDPRDAREGWR